MGIIAEVDKLMLAAMRDKDELVLATLRMLKAGLKNKSIELIKKELSEEEVVAVVRGEIKKRKDAAEEFVKGGRQDLADKENAEMAILNKFLPAEISAEEIKEVARKVVSDLSEEDKKNFGKVMAAVMARLKGQASGGAISEAVKDLLAK